MALGRTLFIVNPAARHGETRRLLPALARSLADLEDTCIVLVLVAVRPEPDLAKSEPWPKRDWHRPYLSSQSRRTRRTESRLATRLLSA